MHDEELEKSDEDYKVKEFDKRRIMENCDFENDKLDRRVLFEMTGERYHEDDFPFETTESENEDGGNLEDSSTGKRSESLVR